MWNRLRPGDCAPVACIQAVTIPPPRPAVLPGGGIGGRGRTGFKDRGMNPTQSALFPPIPTLNEDDRFASNASN